MKIIRTGAVSLLTTFALVLALGITATPASAQATRTWVSGVGDDANPCSRTAPCKTFAGAISKTATGGEINCLDPGGFGGVTITKSITIDCEDTQGSILAANTNGVIINALTTSNIILRGISINGASTTTGNGIRFLVGNSLTIEKMIIQNHLGTGANGNGIHFQPSNAAELNVIDTLISNTNNGINIQATGTGSARVTLSDVEITNSTAGGFRVDTTGNTGAGIRFNLERVLIATGLDGIIVNSPPATTGVIGLINNAVVNANTGTGISVIGSNVPDLRVGNSTITANGTGVNAGTAEILSFGNNRNIGNVSNNNGAFTGAIIPGT